MVTEPGNVNPGDLTGLEDREALGDLDRISINEHLDGILRIGKVDTGATDGLPMREIRGWIGLSLSRGRLGALELGGGDDRADEGGGGPRVLEEPSSKRSRS